MPDPSLTIVIPVFNEAESLKPLVEELQEVLSSLERHVEIIFVDDGSTDGSGEVLSDLLAADDRLRLVRLPHNSGKSAALDAGFRRARGAFVVMMDADLQNDPADIPQLLDRLSSCDAVSGVRLQRRDGWLRRASSTVANGVRRQITGDPTTDSGCGMQAFRRDVLAEIQMFDGMHRFLPTLVRMTGARVEEVPVRHRPRIAGESKYGLWNRAFRTVGDLLAVRWLRNRRVDRPRSEETTLAERGTSDGV